MSRVLARVLTIFFAVIGILGRRSQPEVPLVRRIVVVHYLLLGDTILLAALMAKLAREYPLAERIILARPAVASLFSGKPWGFRAISYDKKKLSSLLELRRSGPFDLAYVVDDNRYSWLARAISAKWIVGFGEDVPKWKNWMLDEVRSLPDYPVALSDMFAELAPGQPVEHFRRGDWPQPLSPLFELPTSPYVVFHVGASTAVKTWPSERWRKIAQLAFDHGYLPVWSGGRGEESLVAAADPEASYPSFCGKLSLPELWHLLGGASLLVSPDTGVAHLGKLIGLPTITLFGPGSAEMCGYGEFWKDVPGEAITAIDFPCRNQNILFRRNRDWVHRCCRNKNQCSEVSAELPSIPGVSPCMYAIETDDVWLNFKKKLVSIKAD